MTRNRQLTHDKLQDAITRIVEGHPVFVQPVKNLQQITIALVAEEAGVERTTLYKYHSDIIERIQRIKNASDQEQAHKEKTALQKAQAKNHEYLDEIRKIKQQRDLALEENYRLSMELQKIKNSYTQK